MPEPKHCRLYRSHYNRMKPLPFVPAGFWSQVSIFIAIRYRLNWRPVERDKLDPPGDVWVLASGGRRPRSKRLGLHPVFRDPDLGGHRRRSGYTSR